MVNKLEKFATLYVLMGATLWGLLSFFDVNFIGWFGTFGKWVHASIAVAGAYAIYKYWKTR